MMHDLEEQKRAYEELDEDRKLEIQGERAKLKAMFREDDETEESYFPLIVKANQAGSLETLLTEANKIIGVHFQI